MRAVTLTSDAITRAFDAYAKACQAAKSSNIGISAFGRLLEAAAFLAQTTIENESVNGSVLLQAEQTDFVSLLPTGWRNLYSYIQGGGLVGGHFVECSNTTPVELNLDSLKGYLSCTGDNTSFVVVQVSGQMFTTKGLLFLAVPLSEVIPFGSKFASGDNFRSALRTSLSVSIEKRRVTVSFGGLGLLALENGEIHMFQDDQQAVSHMLSRSENFINALRVHMEKFHESNGERSTYASLREVLNRIAQARHGATLILNSKWPIDDEQRFQPGGIESNIALGELILEDATNRVVGYQDCCGNDDEMYVDTATRITSENLTSAKNAIVRLSQTDGALVFNGTLTLRGAGVFLKTLSSAQGGGGSRHKSAESFVASNRETAAIVISQDGGVSLYG